MPARLRDPVAWSRLLQLLKTVAAAVIAWELARRVFDLEQPFLAPWAALLTVHATVYRTFHRGAQQVGATVIGVVLAFSAASLLGVGAWSLGLVLLGGLLAGSVRGLRAESTTAAATALVVLLAGYAGDDAMVLTRLADTGIGIAVGLLVNLLVWAPMGDRAAARCVDALDDRVGELLRAIAAGLRAGDDALDGWTERTRDIDNDIDEAWGLVRQARESAWLNPRRHTSRRAHATVGLERLLQRLEQANAETRSMVRTITIAGTATETWDAHFVAPWLALLERAGAAVGAADRDAVGAVRRDVETLGGDLAAELMESRRWPVYGALLVNLRNIVEAMDEVAGAQPVRAAVALA